LPVLRANGHEIRSSLRIVVTLEADGTAMVFVAVIFHDFRTLYTRGRGAASSAPTGQVALVKRIH
jgi:hypothetical protein